MLRKVICMYFRFKWLGIW